MHANQNTALTSWNTLMFCSEATDRRNTGNATVSPNLEIQGKHYVSGKSKNSWNLGIHRMHGNQNTALTSWNTLMFCSEATDCRNAGNTTFSLNLGIQWKHNVSGKSKIS